MLWIFLIEKGFVPWAENLEPVPREPGIKEGMALRACSYQPALG